MISVAGRRRQPDHRRHDRATRSTVSDDDERPAVRKRHQRVVDRRNCTCAHFDETLATAAPSVSAVSPRRCLDRITLGHLIKRESLPHADVDLAQPRIRRDGQPGDVGERLCGLARTNEIRGHNGGRREAGE